MPYSRDVGLLEGLGISWLGPTPNSQGRSPTRDTCWQWDERRVSNSCRCSHCHSPYHCTGSRYGLWVSSQSDSYQRGAPWSGPKGWVSLTLLLYRSVLVFYSFLYSAASLLEQVAWEQYCIWLHCPGFFSILRNHCTIQNDQQFLVRRLSYITGRCQQYLAKLESEPYASPIPK